jgi:diguanylate cyclase (GGDEF)-like protein/PAS domain S-box-containing protein
MTSPADSLACFTWGRHGPEGGDINGCGEAGAGDLATIGFLAPVVHGYVFGNVLNGVREIAASRRARVLAVQSLDAGYVADPGDLAFTSRVAWDRVDALIAGQQTVPDSYLGEFAATGKPLVTVFRQPDGVPCPAVVPDNAGGIRAAVDHLVEHGHSTIAFVGRHPANADDRIRYDAYEKAMAAHGLTPTACATVTWQQDEVYLGEAAADQLMTMSPVPTAVVACTDLTAVSCIKALAARGVAVPDDLAVIGFDDIVEASTCQPPLSTVAQSFRLAGSTACSLALDMLAGHPVEPGPHCTPVVLVRRESCGCPPSASPAPPTPPGVEGIVEVATARLRQLALDSPDPGEIAGAVRLASRVLAARHGATSVLAAGLNQLVREITNDMSSDVDLTSYDHVFARESVYAQRRHYMISTDLVRRHARAPWSLDWLEDTEFQAGCLAVWEAGRGNRGEPETLRIIAGYERTGSLHLGEESCAAGEFPPKPFVGLVDDLSTDKTFLFLLPVRFDGSDWGFLALAGQLQADDETAFERYNHWVVLLTVALDQEYAIESERKLLEGIRASEQRYAMAAEAASDGLWDWDVDTQTVYYSSRWKALLGYTDDEISATADEWLGRVHPVDRFMVDQLLTRCLAVPHAAESQTVEMEYRLRTAAGAYRWMLTRCRPMCDDTGRVIRLVGSMTDITDRKHREDRLRRDAHHDALTGLPNRLVFLDRLNHAIDRAQAESDYAFAVVFLDLDGFKAINDSYGHEIGDEVLRRVARRISAELRENDVVARFGGDEFVLLLDEIREGAKLCHAVDRIVSALFTPLIVDGRTVRVGASTGVVSSVVGLRTADEYLRYADAAMYRSKTGGDGRPVVLTSSREGLGDPAP